MRLQLLSREDPNKSSFLVTHHKESHFLKVWHYHPELELVLSMRSTGTRFVGDSIMKFNPGDVVLIGKNLPHMWLNDDAYFKENSNLIAEDIVIHFKKEFLGVDFIESKEMNHIFGLINKARYGIKFIEPPLDVSKTIKKLCKMPVGFKRTIKFLRLLNKLSKHSNYVLLSSKDFVTNFKKNQNEKLDKAYEFIIKNFQENIELEDVANLLNMNPSAFSRFFKRASLKTFSRYLNEVRISYACRMLLDGKQNIADICYRSGYNTISNFNRQFKTVVDMSPTEYISQYKDRDMNPNDFNKNNG
ncbi:AraC family transcriptional regulator [Flagellimonas onchidii]|uniref:AraC family transcriptional regulator n=1 Tax=Flagellimonas onchidii TaxID=2562684 RepID=UPI001F111AC7|nr:AraC family transcriptional regulator [Allomuricauda onchidii]